MQTKETVQQLGIEIQRLGRKAFPSMIGKEFDRLLKGRFYQALLVKWQRKLGPPKTSESFYELYDRARALEEQERQYVVRRWSPIQVHRMYYEQDQSLDPGARTHKPSARTNDLSIVCASHSTYCFKYVCVSVICFP